MHDDLSQSLGLGGQGQGKGGAKRVTGEKSKKKFQKTQFWDTHALHQRVPPVGIFFFLDKNGERERERGMNEDEEGREGGGGVRFVRGELECF